MYMVDVTWCRWEAIQYREMTCHQSLAPHILQPPRCPAPHHGQSDTGGQSSSSRQPLCGGQPSNTPCNWQLVITSSVWVTQGFSLASCWLYDLHWHMICLYQNWISWSTGMICCNMWKHVWSCYMLWTIDIMAWLFHENSINYTSLMWLYNLQYMNCVRIVGKGITVLPFETWNHLNSGCIYKYWIDYPVFDNGHF